MHCVRIKIKYRQVRPYFTTDNIISGVITWPVDHDKELKWTSQKCHQIKIYYNKENELK